MSDKREPSDDFFKSFASQQNGSVPKMTSSSLSSSTNAYPPSYYHKPTTTINATSSSSIITCTPNAAAASNALPSIRSSSSTAPRPPTTTTRTASRPTTSSRPLPTSAAITTTTPTTSSTTTAPTMMMMNPATSAATNRPKPGYYGGTVPYSSSPSMSGVGQTTNIMDISLQGTPTSAAYYSSASVSTSSTTTNTTPTAPSPYSNYNYNATTANMTGSSSAASMDTASAPAATTTSHLQNPYLFNNSNLIPPNTDLDAFSGTMDTHATFQGPSANAPSRPFMFMPQISTSTLDPSNSTIGTSMFSNNNYSTYNNTDFEDDLPLLEELGINAEHIVAKMRSVVLPFSRFKGTMSDATVIQDADLAGPVTLGMLLGGELLLSGKLQFGYVYGFGLFGCISMTLVLNLLSPHDAISIWTVTSILGYSLLPVNLLAALKLLVVDLAKWQLLGQFLAFVTVVWSTVASTRLMEQGCNMRNQRYLIAYPIALLYTAFVMMTIF
jgi:protein YIPF5/7